MEDIMNSESEIAKFYSGQTLLITGATGFMGKVLLEKLLRSCPDMDTIFLLLRSKKNGYILERVDKLLAEPVFAKLEKSQLAKVVPISGDISLPGLGLSPENRQLLKERVTTVFHSAAIVRFSDPIRSTMQTNLRGTSEVLRLCQEMQSLRVMVYVSTAYSHCYQQDIEEKTYETPVTPEYILECVDNMTDEQMEIIAPQIVGDWPNSYVFSKALAENLVSRGCGDVPVVIFRPSIVLSCNEEPLPGWNDNLNGPSGVIVGMSVGVIRAMHCDLRKRGDFVPADLAINAMIASAWYATASCNQDDKQSRTTYLNFTSGKRNPLTWREYQDNLLQIGVQFPPSAALWYHGVTMTRFAFMYRFISFFLHFLPALLADTIAFVMGKKRRMVRLNKRIDAQCSVLSYFSCREWNFNDTNVQAIISRMSPYDREHFPCDIQKLNWLKYLQTYYLGLRKYLLKDDESSISSARQKHQRLYYMHRAVQCALVVVAIGVISRLPAIFV